MAQDRPIDKYNSRDRYLMYKHAPTAALQRQSAVIIDFSSEQLLPLGFAWHS